MCPSGALHGAVSARTDTCVAWALGIRFWTRVNDRLDQHRQAEWTETPAGSCSEGRGSHPNQTGSGQHGRAAGQLGIPVLCARELGGSRPSAGTVSYCSLHANGKPKSEQKAPLPGDKPPIDTTTTLPANLSALPQLPPAIPVGPAAARALAVEGGAELDRRFSEWLAKRYRLLARPSYSIDRRVRVRNDAVWRASGRAGRQAALDAWRSCRRAAGVVGRPTCLPAGPVTYCSLFGPAPLSALSSHTPGWPALHACTRSSVWPSAGRPAGHCSLSIIVACRADFWPPWSST